LYEVVVCGIIDRALSACQRSQDVVWRTSSPLWIWIGVTEDEIDFILCLEPCRIRTLAIRHRLSLFRRYAALFGPWCLARWRPAPRASLSFERTEPCEAFAARGRIPCPPPQLSYCVASRFPRSNSPSSSGCRLSTRSR